MSERCTKWTRQFHSGRACNVCKPDRKRSSHVAPLIHAIFANGLSLPSTPMTPDLDPLFTQVGQSKRGLYDAPPSLDTETVPIHALLVGFRTSILSKETKHLSTTTSPCLYSLVLSPEETICPLTMTSKVPLSLLLLPVVTRRQ